MVLRLSFRCAFGLSPQEHLFLFISSNEKIGRKPMRILFLTSAHNSLSQRLWIELGERGHDIRVCVAATDAAMIAAVSHEAPDLIIAPMRFFSADVSARPAEHFPSTLPRDLKFRRRETRQKRVPKISDLFFGRNRPFDFLDALCQRCDAGFNFIDSKLDFSNSFGKFVKFLVTIQRLISCVNLYLYL